MRHYPVRYPSYRAVDQALQDTRSCFGYDPNAWFPSEEDREIAARFDVSEELRKAIAEQPIQETVDYFKAVHEYAKLHGLQKF